MSDLENITPEELGILAAILGVVPAKSLSLEELNVLGNFLVAVGSIMLTVAAQGEFIKVQKEASQKEAESKKQGETSKEEDKDSGNSVQVQIRELREQLQQHIAQKE